MGYYAELAMELREERTHAAPEGDAFRAYAVSRAFAAGTTDAPAKKAKGRKPRLRTAA